MTSPNALTTFEIPSYFTDNVPDGIIAAPKKPQEFPECLMFLWFAHRFKVIHGGRGAGGKSWNVARALLYLGRNNRLKILCCREFQVSITDSVHAILKLQIENLDLGYFYDVQRDVIRGQNGTEFIFVGLHNNTSKVKSTEGVDIAWVEEAETVSKQSWTDLTPTIRKRHSEIWVTFNPRDPKDATSQMFLDENLQTLPVDKLPDPDTVVVRVVTGDNPEFPDVLRGEMAKDFRVDPDLAAHKWGGEYRRNSHAQIFREKYIIDTFEPQRSWFGPYFGSDFGFANDPGTVIKMWLEFLQVEDGLDVNGKTKFRIQKKLYIEEESVGYHVELKDLYKLYVGGEIADKRFPGVNGIQNWVKTRSGEMVLHPVQPFIRCDNSRPETISHLRGSFLNTVDAKKWPMSVEEGIIWLRGLDLIVIHPRCKFTAEEFRLYSFKVDKNTGEVLKVIIDRFNHSIDAIRYGLEPFISAESEILVVFDEGTPISGDLDEFDMMNTHQELSF